MLRSDDKRPIAVDLFCGAGGMSLGFEQAGFRVAGAVDLDPIHVATHRINFPHCRTIQADLATSSADDLRASMGLADQHIDILVGGPPCQGFSMMGRRQENDPRSELLLRFAGLICDLHPSYFVMENVEGLRMGAARTFLDRFLASVVRAGYSVVNPVQVLDASDFGVPQRRRRVFVLGYRDDVPSPTYPSAWCLDDESPTVWDAIKDLPDVDRVPELSATGTYTGRLGKPSEYARQLRSERKELDETSSMHPQTSKSLTGCMATVHTAETRRRFAATIPGTYEPITHFYRLAKPGLAPTLRAGTDKTRGSYMAPRPIHPTQSRCITVREAARLHSFPDWFQFHATKWHSFRQVGNSVPPRLAQSVATSIKGAVDRQKE